MDEIRTRGLQVFSELMGEAPATEMRRGIESGGLGAALSGLATDYAFGAVWSRDGLERKQRSLVTIGVLIAQRQPNELKNHVHIALTNGLTRREIEEAVLQAVPYVGFPAVVTARGAMMKAFQERGLTGNDPRGDLPDGRKGIAG